jgi:hypothetical protein
MDIAAAADVEVITTIVAQSPNFRDIPTYVASRIHCGKDGSEEPCCHEKCKESGMTVSFES